MIKFENTEVFGWEHAIRGMRNPMNSWVKSDSGLGCDYSDQHFVVFAKMVILKHALIVSSSINSALTTSIS